MNLTAIRLITSGLLFLLTLCVGTVPVYLYQKWMRRKAQREIERQDSSGHEPILSANFYVQAVTQVGGGILFFTVLVHMIPEIRNNFEEYLKSNNSVFNDETGSPQSIKDLSLPYLEIAICVGFFATYLAEVVMHSLLDKRHKTEVIQVLNDETLNRGLNDNNSGSESQSTVNNSSTRDDQDHDEPNHSFWTQREEDEQAIIAADHISENEDHEEDDVTKDRLLMRFLHGLVIIGSFSIHCIFDGIAIGVRVESSEIWTMFMAITSHKLMIALIISVELYEKCKNILLVVFHITLFSIMSPIGIIIVLFTQQTLDTHSDANPIVILLSAIASGTILYIVFFEILQKNRVSKLPLIIQFIAMFIGFGLMFIITITLSEE